ncbi:PREDICTED: FH1/FH2 domain-containing protein 3 isoform X2 [Nicrophorus vespilloides]|uniref:FH1/FH2 domain-containing protein 3 isoform X2 n=1 Tax=Nicrophorus vespilloides TaxID=110193 RepID=A0ABM1MEH0_NICVS|nr:PREDICTED: FH1/FH2 domain-containing protein 3 isoform X2 [Nicrophorus vespilloides]
MLYVDGMNGVMDHNQTVQWLYTLISSKFRLVVKTALKLLLVFVEYTDSNCKLLIRAIQAVDCNQGLLPWHNIMKLLKDFDSADTELLIYATTLINKCLNGVPDQDTYYDQTDALEEQGIENIIKRYMSKPGTDLDLLQQFQIYEAVLQYEDGEDKGTPIRHLDESIRKTLMSRKSLIDSAERRKSRRHSTCTTPVHGNLNNNNVIKSTPLLSNNEEDDESSSSQSSNGLNQMNGSYRDSSKGNDVGVTPALRRRRERAERQRSFMKEQQENANLLRSNSTTNSDDINENGNYTNGLQQRLSNGNNVLNRNSSRKDLTPYLNAVNKLDSEENNGLSKQQPWIMYKDDQNNDQENDEDSENANENDRKMLIQLKKENTVKDLTQKLSNQNILLHSPSSEDNKINRIEGMTGLISKAKEGLAKSKSQANVVKSATGDNIPKVVEVKKSENELRWEELVSGMSRPLNLCDMDFTDLGSEDEADILAPVTVTNGIPPPPPPLDVGAAPPPPPRFAPPVPSPPVFGINLQKMSNKPTETKIPVKKNKKTVKLFWKEVRDEPMQTVKLKTGYIWDELNPVSVDTQKLEHLFESRAKDLINKKQQELNKNKEIIVLDPKRSNAINIGMTKLPPPRSIKTAILKMDATIMNREGIEKLLTMLPTEEERSKIQEAQAANPDLPLGSAEQFLLTLASISELPARLKLWAFKLDFENTEREIAEPLMDLKQGYEVLRINKTFRGILSTLLSIGNFLNGNEVKGFQIEYLSKVPEVKDTVHKHSLLHHLCHIVMEKFPDATDLYSEIGAITRASKVDFDELALNIQRLEADCKASWDHLKLIAKHDGSTMKSKMMDFLADCAERIILLGIIQRRVMNRFHKFLLWLGIPSHQISDSKPNEFCRIVSEFALEYRTTRERVLQQLEKKANHRERNKTRGKMITETAKFRTTEDRADAELRQLLGSDISDVESMQGTLTFRRTRKDGNRSLMGTMKGHLHDGDDEILDCLVKTATKAPTSRTAPRERKRTRHADRKSLKRSRTRENPFGHRDSP